jgi:hypothetical protein
MYTIPSDVTSKETAVFVVGVGRTWLLSSSYVVRCSLSVTSEWVKLPNLPIMKLVASQTCTAGRRLYCAPPMQDHDVINLLTFHESTQDKRQISVGPRDSSTRSSSVGSVRQGALKCASTGVCVTVTSFIEWQSLSHCTSMFLWSP